MHTTAQTATAMITALTAIGALVFTGLSLNNARQQNEVTAQGQYTDRYTKAVEQLDRTGADHLQARLGGIYALERLAHDPPRDQSTIIDVLSAFIRTNSPRPSSNAGFPGAFDECPGIDVPVDIQAALTVLGRRDTFNEGDTRPNLSTTCLSGADLIGTNLSNVDLHDADLSFADLRGENLSNANLDGANFTFANMTNANLLRSDLSFASLRNADLSSAYLETTDLTLVNICNAELDNAKREDGTAVERSDIQTPEAGRWC